MLVTCVTQKGLKSQQDEWVFYLSLLLLNPWMKSYDVTIYMNFSLAVLSHGTKDFVKYVGLTFESVDEILWCCHSAVLSQGTIYLLCSSNF